MAWPGCQKRSAGAKGFIFELIHVAPFFIDTDNDSCFHFYQASRLWLTQRKWMHDACVCVCVLLLFVCCSCSLSRGELCTSLTTPYTLEY